MVKEIRNFYNNQDYTFSMLMEKYSLSYGGIQKIIENKTWFDPNYMRVCFYIIKIISKFQFNKKIKLQLRGSQWSNLKSREVNRTVK
ncbi:MAG: hypothetical protein WC516_04510 [Patescibacteria group bacterium]|jgi:hypothetical protein